LICLWKSGAGHVFLCNQDHPEILTLLPLLRLTGRKAYAMLDGKFDDHLRNVFFEFLKPPVFRLFNGGLIAGARHLNYYRFLSMSPDWARVGYDTVSVERVRTMSGETLAPGGLPHAERDFIVVARFVPKKNLSLALNGFAAFRQTRPSSHRRLILCGSGPLETDLRSLAGRLGVAEWVTFRGFLGPDEVAKTLARGLALVLPSVDEQWGLVVNEAVALGIPVLCSDNVGARDSLVRSGVNGFVFEPDNADGLGTLMRILSDDAVLWIAMSQACQQFVGAADVEAFVQGVKELVERGLATRVRGNSTATTAKFGWLRER
jgi:L-malate glycosyltransferase